MNKEAIVVNAMITLYPTGNGWVGGYVLEDGDLTVSVRCLGKGVVDVVKGYEMVADRFEIRVAYKGKKYNETCHSTEHTVLTEVRNMLRSFRRWCKNIERSHKTRKNLASDKHNTIHRRLDLVENLLGDL